MSSSARRAILIFVVGLAMLVATLTVLYLMRPPGNGRLEAISGPQIGGPFALVDHEGRRVTQETYAGRHLLVFFGFTHCPDICPLALGEVSVALDALGPAATKVQPLFITVDPERDTPAALKDFVTAFDDRIVGLTGSPEEVAAVARAYRVYFQKVPVQGALGYTMDHSAFVYLAGPDGKLEAFFTHETKGDAMAQKMRAFLTKS